MLKEGLQNRNYIKLSKSQQVATYIKHGYYRISERFVCICKDRQI